MPREGRLLWAALVALAVALFGRPAAAHAVGVSRGEWTVDGARVTGEVAFAQSELLASFDNADPLAVDVAALIDVSADGAACPGSLDLARAAENDGAIFRITWTCPRAPRSLRIAAPILDELSRGHRLVARAHADGATVDDVLYVGHDALTVDVGPTTSAPPPAPSLAAFVAMGMEHILTGYDHLLFLFGLVLVSGRIRSLLGTVTAFTAAHSVTLAVAALGLWAPSPRLVEPAIALSIAYVGVENFFLRDAAKRWRITLPFGLVHGFGFAGALREIDLPRAQVPSALLGFNVGVEIGQLAVMAVLLPALFLLRQRRWFEPRGVRALSGAIVAVGLAWFFARVAA
jgi:hydrogenase/urease accessory protein HupE